VLVLKRSVLTEKIARRGYHLSREYDVDPLEVLFVGEVMQRDLLTYEDDLTAGAALDAITGTDPADVTNRRQLLYPVVSSSDTLVGVVTRTMLEAAVHDGRADQQLAKFCITTPVVVHANQTLREVAVTMAARGVDRVPVVDRTDRSRVIGFVALHMLLEGRLRDLQEARHSERVLRLRIVRPGWFGRPRETQTISAP
jgi:CBS domain-containing protein